jgi:uncharacterized membrane protein
MSSTNRFLQLGAHTSGGVLWRIKRNCALRPQQLCVAFTMLCVVSLLVAGFFWWMGAVLVLPFAVLELLVLGVAFFVYARHATDGERILLDADNLWVEWEHAGRLQRFQMARHFLQVLPRRGHGLVELVGAGGQVAVGRYLRPEQRDQLAKELRWALSSQGLG